ncbi:MAG: FtsQ-type POTRA domain-containing protein [Desulfarculales bacterium]|jgi:cell division protein FtsQ|nr:FtsQ-type POTRA domain-containing protein [Desulfarculales bacterium]
MWSLKHNYNKLSARITRAQDLDSRLNRQKSARRVLRSENETGIARRFWLRAVDPAVKLVFMLALSGVLLLCGYVGLARSSWFDLREIKITGARHLSRLDILSAGGLGSHTGLLNMKPALVEAGIRENLPWINEVKIRRSLPDSIVIHVVEEIPYAVGLIDEQWFYLNHDLKPFAPYDYRHGYDLPVISGLSRAELLAEDQELEDLLIQARELLDKAADLDLELTGKVSQLEINKNKGMIMAFAKIPAAVVLGSNFNGRRFNHFQQIIRDLADRDELSGLLLMDLSQEKIVIVRLEQDSV